MSEKICYLMRGLASSGKSTRAKQLAGGTGRVFDVDEFFISQVGDRDSVDDSASKKAMEKASKKAHAWNFERFKQAIDDGVSPIVVDWNNVPSLESKAYALYAQVKGYEVQLQEPQTLWWQEIRVLLKYKKYNLPVLQRWAVWLTKLNSATHNIPLQTVWSEILAWEHSLRAEDFINYVPKANKDVEQPTNGQDKAVDLKRLNLDKDLDFYKVNMPEYLSEHLPLQDMETDESQNLDELIADQSGWRLVDTI